MKIIDNGFAVDVTDKVLQAKIRKTLFGEIKNNEQPKPKKRKIAGKWTEWSKKEDEQLLELYKKGIKRKEIARVLGRSVGAVYSRNYTLNHPNNYLPKV